MEVKYEHRFTELEACCKRHEERLGELEKRQDNLDDLVGSVKVLAAREERVEKDVKEIKADVKNLNSKPAKRWDNLVNQVLSIIIGAVLGFVITKIGL